LSVGLARRERILPTAACSAKFIKSESEATMSTTNLESSLPSGALPEWLEIVWQQVGSLRYGAVEITVHDSKVIQIEKIERVRLDKPKPEAHKKHKL
jgi:hypothetical protein